MNVSAVLIALVSVAYLATTVRVGVRADATGAKRARAAAFFGAMAVMALALGPLDAAAARFQWVHMSQHLLIVVVVAPLIVLAEPWIMPLLVLPRAWRGPAGEVVFRSRSTRPARRVATVLAIPVIAWITFNAVFAAWHIPFLYDLTLRNDAVHIAEHTMLLTAAIIFWLPVLRVRARANTAIMSPRDSLAYLIAAAFAGSALAGWLVLSPTTLYTGYPVTDGLSAMADQRLAGGVMIGPGSAVIALAAGAVIYRWLGQLERAEADLPVPQGATR